MITLRLNNTKFQVLGDLKIRNKLYALLAIRNQNAFYLRKYMPKGWDGKIHYMTDAGYVQAGLFTETVRLINEMGVEYKVDDLRELDRMKIKTVTQLGNLTPRDYQYAAVDALVTNMVGDTYMPRGIFKVATNGGKTIIAALTYKSFKKKCIWITGSKELFTQALKELEELIPGEVGWIGKEGKQKIKWNKFMVVMVKTASNMIHEIKNELTQYETLIVDECDLSDNKTFKSVLINLWNCPIKLGMSGTIFMSKLKKDEARNMNMRAMFGELLYDITNRKLIDAGHSSKVRVKFIRGNTDEVDPTLSYGEVYEQYIVNNKKRNLRIAKRVTKKFLLGYKPILVIAQRQKHILKLYRLLKKKLPGARIDWVHHARKERHEVVASFKDGFLDILVGSMILKRGKNFPLMHYMINTGGGKAPENPLQLLGRAMRKHSSKKFTTFEDMWDLGKYLKSHSRRRFIYYKNEQIPVKNKYS